MKRIWYLLLALTAVVFMGGLFGQAKGHRLHGDDGIELSAASRGPRLRGDDKVITSQGTGRSVEQIKKVSDTPHIKFVSIARGFLGLGALIFIAWIFSANRKGISWKIVLIGLGIQLLLAIGVLMIRPVQQFFEVAGKIFVTVMDFSRSGSQFLFGSLLDINKFGSIFAFQILPTIIFFSALTSLLFYLGIIQKVVGVLARLLSKAFRISGAESLVVTGNIFLGQLEAPLMVKGYLERMNRSEILLVMVAGMATIAGGVMAIYIGFLGGDNPLQRLLFAKHLLAASVMAAPGAVVIARILYPQGEVSNVDKDFDKGTFGDNALDSIAKGTFQGLKMAAGVGAMLLVFLAFIAMINFVFIKIGSWTNLNPWINDVTAGHYQNLNLQLILGYLFSPLMWLIGVCPQDMALVGQLAGEKLVTNEFVGYISLASLKDAGAFFQDKSIIMATYMLCGFANFASVGMQIGGIGLLAPGKRKWLSEFGMRALLGGTLVSLLSATIVGMIVG
ncbi:MAG: Na+ dependent nucleoside transporter [Bacteroidia bacterium]|nr:Na+ dependent nucleoside transporter [Bacteroidia bacterium]